MRPLPPLVVALGCFVALSVQGLAGAGATRSRADLLKIEGFINGIEKGPVAYQAYRRLEASSSKLNESAWLEAFTEYTPATGFRYRITSEGGSSRIRNRVLKAVLETERENSSQGEWPKAALSRTNYDFAAAGQSPDGLIQVELNPRRRDARLLDGSAWLSAESGGMIRLEGRLSKSPSFWVRWVDVTRHYREVGGTMMPVAVESTADVRIAGVSTFLMRYEYATVAGQQIVSPEIFARR